MNNMKYLTQNKYWDLVEDYNLDKLLYLLIDRPERIIINMRLSWFKKNAGYEYRDYDLPAVISFGNIFWANNKKRKSNNNKNKPIVIYMNGEKYISAISKENS